jgi:hypothetical protein
MPLSPPSQPPVVYLPMAGAAAQSGAFGPTGPPPGDSVPPSMEVPILLMCLVALLP